MLFEFQSESSINWALALTLAALEGRTVLPLVVREARVLIRFRVGASSKSTSSSLSRTLRLADDFLGMGES